MSASDNNLSGGNLSGGERELAEALGRLNPAGVNIDARAIAYRAGRRQAANRLWAYRCATGALSVALGASLTVHSHATTQYQDHVVYLPAPDNASGEGDRSNRTLADYVAARQKILDQNLAAATPTPSENQWASLAGMVRFGGGGSGNGAGNVGGNGGGGSEVGAESKDEGGQQ